MKQLFISVCLIVSNLQADHTAGTGKASYDKDVRKIATKKTNDRHLLFPSVLIIFNS